MSSAKVFFKAALHWYPLSGGHYEKTGIEALASDTFSFQTEYRRCTDEDAVSESFSEYLRDGVLDDIRDLQTPFPDEGYVVVSGEFEVKWSTDYFGEHSEDIEVDFRSHTFCSEEEMVRRGLLKEQGKVNQGLLKE